MAAEGGAAVLPEVSLMVLQQVEVEVQLGAVDHSSSVEEGERQR